MFKTLAIAAFASTMAIAAPITSAEAKTNLNFDIGINVGGGYPVYDRYPAYYEPEHVYQNHCGNARQNVKYQGFRKVRPLDCNGSRFAFKAKRHGDWWLVKTTRAGHIISVSPL